MEVNSPGRKKLQNVGVSTTDVFSGSHSAEQDRIIESAMASKSLNQIMPPKDDYEIEKES